MHRDKFNKQEKISFFGKKAKKCRTDKEKIKFFDSSKEAFFIDLTLSNKGSTPKDLDDAYYVYANMKKLNESELKELRSLEWIEHPAIFKIFLFDFCILNGNAYLKYFVNSMN